MMREAYAGFMNYEAGVNDHYVVKSPASFRTFAMSFQKL